LITDLIFAPSISARTALSDQEISSVNSMGPSEKTQHAIRRSTRLPLEVPVLLTSLASDHTFSEPCSTTLVNAHGCGLIVGRAIAQGIQVRLEIVSAKRHTTARVAEVVPLGGEPETWLVGLELDIPGNFWGIEYAPSDWKIEETVLPAVERTEPSPVAAAKPVPSRRWRLTDISAGACYLETAAPFPVDTPVLLSIRSAETECLLEGVVRVSHDQAGMGMEFTEVPEDKRRAKVEQLIERLTANREVPKIFVGRREGRQEAKKQVSDAPEVSSDTSAPDADPLLALIREGTALGTEQFLEDLRAQRLGNRREPRVEIAVPVLLNGSDVNGRPLDQRVMTVNVSRRGAVLSGIYGEVRVGDEISLARGRDKAQFRVQWAGEENTAKAGQIGVAAVDADTTFWNEVLETASGGASPLGGTR
jgi:hypothetical protein